MISWRIVNFDARMFCTDRKQSHCQSSTNSLWVTTARMLYSLRPRLCPDGVSRLAEMARKSCLACLLYLISSPNTILKCKQIVATKFPFDGHLAVPVSLHPSHRPSLTSRDSNADDPISSSATGHLALFDPFSLPGPRSSDERKVPPQSRLPSFLRQPIFLPLIPAPPA